MAYREKPDLLGDPLTPKGGKERPYVLWIFALIVLAPNVGRLAKAIGFRASYEIVLVSAIGMGALCVIGAAVSYRMTRDQVERDKAEINSVTDRGFKRN